MAKIEILIPFVQGWEGGFVNDPLDKGGATNMGITLKTFRQIYGAYATVEQLKNITANQWLHIFREEYWNCWRADQIDNQSVANILVDWLWCSGNVAIKTPQSILHVKADGIVGPKTLAVLNAQNQYDLFHQIQCARLNFVDSIVKRDRSQVRFIRGWKNRINALKFE